MLFLVFCAFESISFFGDNHYGDMVAISSPLLLAALRQHPAYIVLSISIITEF